MRTFVRFVRARWWFLLFPALVACGVAAAEQVKSGPDTAKGLVESRSDGALELREAVVILDRVAWIQGEVGAKEGEGGGSRPFSELLVKTGGEWRVLLRRLGTGEAEGVGQAEPKQDPSACSCEPCAGCSPRRGR